MENYKSRSLRLECLLPHEIHEIQRNSSAVFIPVGPLEWHGPHNAIGLDALNAEKLAFKIAEIIGGVVTPTFFFGTECARDADFLKTLKFEDPTQYIVGMDFPETTLPSAYVREEIFGVALREYIRTMAHMGFKNIIIINGHGAVGQVLTIERLIRECSYEYGCNVFSYFGLQEVPEVNCCLGHATKLETSILMSIDSNLVDLTQLPTKEEEPYLSTQKYGMMEQMDWYARKQKDEIWDDPRDATAKIGQTHMDYVVNCIVKDIKEKTN